MKTVTIFATNNKARGKQSNTAAVGGPWHAAGNDVTFPTPKLQHTTPKILVWITENIINGVQLYCTVI